MKLYNYKLQRFNPFSKKELLTGSSKKTGFICHSERNGESTPPYILGREEYTPLFIPPLTKGREGRGYRSNFLTNLHSKLFLYKFWNFICYIICFCSFINVLMLYSKDYKYDVPVNLFNINSQEDDYAPSWNIYENRLYYNSELTGKSLFYYIDYKSDSLSKPVLLISDINKRNNNQSYLTFVARDTAYYSTFHSDEKRTYLNIFKTVFKKNNWSESILLDSLSGSFFCSHVTISPGSRFMIFSTNKFSNAKDADLAIAYRNSDGTWGNVRLISEISYPDLNTTGNEITPFLASDDTLYFASNGYHGTTDSADYDIFFSVLENGIWQKPEPLTELNTTYDESDFIISPSGVAYFASNRPGGKGNLDIYSSKKITGYDTENSITNNQIILETPNKYISARLFYKYKFIQVIPFIDCSDSDYVNKIFNKVFLKENKYYFADLSDSIYKYSLDIISNRLLIQSGSNLIINYINGNPVTEITARRIKSAIIDNYGINSNRINLKSNDSNNVSLKSNNIIWFDSDDAKLFDAQRTIAVIDDIIIEPKYLEIYIEGIPPGNIKSWTCKFITNNNVIDSVTDSITPKTLNIDLKKYADKLISCDSLQIELEATDINNKIVNTNKSVQISIPESREQYLETTDNKIFEVYSLYILNYDTFINDNVYNGIKEIIIAATDKSKKIIIEYDKEFQNKELADKIADFIIRKTNFKKSKIEIKTEDFKNLIPNNLIKYYFRILFEK
jgi:hypothetical protein